MGHLGSGMRRLRAAALVVGAFVGGMRGSTRKRRPRARKAERGAGKQARAGLFINVTRGKEDVHAVSMALAFACSALREGRRVVLFFNVAAPIFASSKLRHDVRVADFPPVRQMLREVIDRGARVLVCGHCAKLAHVDRSRLLPGVTLASHEDVLSAIEPGMVGISY